MEHNCPTCGEKTKWVGNIYRPFCSDRCKTIDLGSWADESYRIEVFGEETEHNINIKDGYDKEEL